MSEAPEVLKPLKTWSYLANRRKRPSEYEIVSTNLHYRQNNPDCPWELDPNLPLNEWYRKYCNNSPLKHPDWDSFRDPDEMIYRTYNLLQDGQENYVNGLLDQFNEREHDKALDAGWVSQLQRLYTPVRYLYHTVQMASAYVAQMAPSSTITTVHYFQSADALRWVTHAGYRTAELAQTYPDAGFGKTERASWEDDAVWQGFRELMEKVLVTWDWAEACVALDLVAKPAIEETLMGALGDAARHQDDTLYGLLSQAQMRDAERHRRWASALVAMALTQDGNEALIKGWIAKWKPLADKAIDAYCAALPDGAAAAAAAKARVAAFHASINLA